MTLRERGEFLYLACKQASLCCSLICSDTPQKRARYVFERESGSEEENETAAEKRLRLAEQYLSQLQEAGKKMER